jgi:two-component sensor histidine kinase
VAFITAGLCIVAVISALRTRLLHVEERRDALQAHDAGQTALLKELMHRVGNDLNAVISIAELQAAIASHEETRQSLARVADRLHVFGNVYKRLHVAADHVAALDMRAFLEGLCNDLRTAHLSLRPVSLKIRSDHCSLVASRAALVGLVLNEAVTNALKHAFPDDRAGMIWIEFGRDPQAPDLLLLTVTDDGVGTSAAGAKGTGMGQRLMRGMASQLGGTYALVREGEVTVVHLRFREAQL